LTAPVRTHQGHWALTALAQKHLARWASVQEVSMVEGVPVPVVLLALDQPSHAALRAAAVLLVVRAWERPQALSSAFRLVVSAPVAGV
jgi:hypothetical protein